MNALHKVNPRDKEDGNGLEQQLYETRQKIYPRLVHGIFARLRVSAILILLGLFYGVAWLRWDGHQAVLFDLPARKFYIFGLTFWPQDFFYLAALLIVAALSLFFFTSLAGRLWCGYACPQTVWTEVFLWMERKIEGDRGKQMKLDKSPFSARKFSIKAAKHFVWIVFALWTGFTFVGYFTPIVELGQKIIGLSTGSWETFWILFYGFATYGNAGWLREQVCIYMCPYARFQSAMFDKNTLVISYDPKRGEPRGSRKRGVEPQSVGLGDCIDCTMCVQACPTGIDIRDGLQYQCIGCAACIDACDNVMDKIGYSKGLIKYTTENAVEGTKTKVLRPRIFVYGFILLTVLGAVAFGIATRPVVGLDVIRDRNSLYRETDEGLIENVYTLKILNKSHEEHIFQITASGIENLSVLTDESEIRAAAGQVLDVPVRLQADPVDLYNRRSDVFVTIRSLSKNEVTTSEETRFLGP